MKPTVREDVDNLRRQLGLPVGWDWRTSQGPLGRVARAALRNGPCTSYCWHDTIDGVGYCECGFAEVAHQPSFYRCSPECRGVGYCDGSCKGA